MRPETEKLIETKKVLWSGDPFGTTDAIFVSDIQKVIDCETKFLNEELEKVRDLANMYHDEKEELENLQEEMKGNAYCAGRADAEEEFSNLQNFIRNCEDIPGDIKEVIGKEFFNML